ncbi:MAG: hypothetical protein OXU86_02300 [Thaumarchaeota archaeon]|nr:hypothetical protein [Nitrososphaerota archaeon]RNJ71338.1 MAG: hypothetical protein EB824_06940 [Thaumarchaeota archaeon S15]RNJ73010.1 MAG: hypothetical protein EB832_02645 [Thaumarchaeota archaeon S14]MDD9809417.1 hypothetical protein [Nitrososphaerota archaeon]MDD9812713.1 hypothetical protein [Nitrososphaerota archaeon]
MAGSMGTRELLYKGSVLGAMITGPSLVAFAAVWHYSGDMAAAAGVAAAVHVGALVMAFKFAKRFLVRGVPPGGQ